MKAVIVGVLWGASVSAAELTPFAFDASIAPGDRSRESQIRAAHEAIENGGGNRHAARLAILYSMDGKTGARWTMEEEGQGYVIARNDIKGNTLLVKVEYDERYVQIKFHHGFDDFHCENLVGDYCYDNHRHYYNFVARLRKSIIKQLAELNQ
ncbi:hypothetical protein [Permianibacter aggregans]|uniref:Uncharacterized protein n=1 Tax=Permianibacter aggregans TaxID=1510150 RepID=A0A4R6UV81_9GAMM|nr:hypothetical protein [Permianibacter aggregans]QGX39533.1 hypothetical protein E2H98_07635 [Permianibacter aggregans]TDQ49723.1 hypothetical protein EV696_10392 [Permianibacter aggregans]